MELSIYVKTRVKTRSYYKRDRQLEHGGTGAINTVFPSFKKLPKGHPSCVLKDGQDRPVGSEVGEKWVAGGKNCV